MEIQVKKKLDDKNCGIKAINEMKDVVIDDNVNYIERNPSLFVIEIKAFLVLLTRIIVVSEKLKYTDLVFK